METTNFPSRHSVQSFRCGTILTNYQPNCRYADKIPMSAEFSNSRAKQNLGTEVVMIICLFAFPSTLDFRLVLGLAPVILFRLVK